MSFYWTTGSLIIFMSNLLSCSFELDMKNAFITRGQAVLSNSLIGYYTTYNSADRRPSGRFSRIEHDSLPKALPSRMV